MNDMTQQTEAFAFPSVMLGVPEDVYHRIDALSSSKIKRARTHSLYHLRFDEQAEDEDTESKSMGTLFHALVLEPEKEAIYRGIPPECGLGSNADKAAYVRWLASVVGEDPPKPPLGANGKPMAEGVGYSWQIGLLETKAKSMGLRLVKEAQLDGAKQMRDNLMRNRTLRAIFEDGGESEVTLLWLDPVTGIRCKARVDYLPAMHNVMLDLKSINDGGLKSCVTSFTRFAYPIQHAHYMEGARALGLSHNDFRFVVSETAPPRQSRWFTLPYDVVEEARRTVREVIDEYARAMESGVWDSYPEGCEVLKLSKAAALPRVRNA